MPVRVRLLASAPALYQIRYASLEMQLVQGSQEKTNRNRSQDA
jgi:hypothetical protein